MAGHRILVASLRSIKEGIRIDRGFSPLANPFKLDDPTNETERKAKLEEYRQRLWRQMRQPENRELAELQRLARLVREQDVTILCWCAPKLCHGQVVARAVRWIMEKANE